MISPKIPCTMALPYGLTSSKAMKIGYMDNKYAKIIYSEKMPMEERIELSRKVVKRIDKEISLTNKPPFLKRANRKYGKDPLQTFSYISLTDYSIRYLCNLWLTNETETNLPMDSLKKEMARFLATKHNALYRTLLHDNEPDCYINDSPKYSFLEAVVMTSFTVIDSYTDMIDSEKLISYRMSLTPLGLYPAIAERVSVSFNSTWSSKMYSIYRTSNINALFIANGYLTYIDRRPYDTNWSVNKIWSDDDIEKLIAQEKVDLPTYCCYTLRHYYRNNPLLFSFLNPVMTREQWESMPVFYATNELPPYNGLDEVSNEVNASKQSLHYTFSGLAIGKTDAYIVHHTQRLKTPWQKNLEHETIQSMTSALRSLHLSCNADITSVSNAIVVCETPRQMKNFLMERQSENAQKPKSATFLSAPYLSVFFVPLNSSGAAEMSLLMEYQPDSIQSILSYHLYKTNSAKLTLIENPMSIYTLIYRENQEATPVPVFVGHTMNLDHLAILIDDYNSGKEFIISCYPQQVSYYQELMPDARFI